MMGKLRTIVEIAKIMWRARNDGFHWDRVETLRNSMSLKDKLLFVRAWADSGARIVSAGGSPVRMVLMERGGFESVADFESRFEDWSVYPVSGKSRSP